MIPNNQKTAVAEGSLQGQQFKMGIAAESFGHIMSILTDMYSDQKMAVIREYSTNARDSNLEAGNTAPIEITLPGMFSPYFVVKDHGLGLNVNDIEAIYSQYGESTKRNSDLTNGMLGIGCKSALSYTNQFTVVSVKNGVQSTVSVSRTEDGAGMMEVVDTCATNLDNYTAVSVPVKNEDFNAFKNKAVEFFKYWPEGSVLIDGQPHQRFKGEEITKDIWVVKKLNEWSGGTSVVVMGGVAYPIKQELLERVPTDSYLVMFVPMGSVNFTPAREALMYTALTRKTIEDHAQRYVDSIITKVQTEINKAKSHPEALREFKKWEGIFSFIDRQDFKYKNKQFPIPGDPILRNPRKLVTYPGNKVMGRSIDPNGYGSTKSGRSYTIDYEMMEKSVCVVYNYPNTDKMSSPQKLRILQYLSNEKLSGVFPNRSTRVILYADKKETFPRSVWWDDIGMGDWHEIKKIDMGHIRYGNAAITYDGKYDVWENDQWVMKHLKASDEVIYWSTADYKMSSANLKALTKMFPSATLVKANRNRWAKLWRLYPKNKGIYSAIQGYGDDLLNNLSYATRVNLSHSSKPSYDQNKIDDPAVKEFLDAFDDKIAKANATDIRNEATVMHQVLGVRLNINSIGVQNPFGKYPLAAEIYREDTYHYMNDKYAREKK